MKWERLKGDENFKEVRSSGKQWRGRFIRAVFRKDDSVEFRVGIIVSKRASKLAVSRNKLRRRIKAALEGTLKTNDPLNGDLVIIGMKEAVNSEYQEIAKEIEKMYLFFRRV